MGPQLFVKPKLIALVEKIEVLITQRGQKGIGIEKLMRFPTSPRYPQPVSKYPGAPRYKHFEKACGIQTRHGPGLISREFGYRAIRGVPQKCTDHHALTSPLLVRLHPKIVMGMAGSCVKKLAQRLFLDDHT